MEVQRIRAPDGSELVVLHAADFERIMAAAEDVLDRAEGEAARAEARQEGFMPGAVLKAVLDGVNPVAAWRGYRGLSQAELADRAGLTQAAVARIEKAPAGAGRSATRRRLATALDAPLWTMEGPEEGSAA